MSIERFPDAACSPEVLLHLVLEDMSDVKGAIVLTVNEHGAVEIYTCQITLGELALAAIKFQNYATTVIAGNPPEGTDIRVPPASA